MSGMSGYQQFPFAKGKEIQMLVLDVDGVLTAGQIFLDDAGDQLKAFNVRDGHGIKLIQRAGVEVAIITGRTSKVVEHRARELGIQHVIQGSKNKGLSIQQLAADTGAALSGCAMMGDDVVDLPAMTYCGLTMAPADAHKGVLQTVDWVSDYNGGHGAVRQLCEAILLAKGYWSEVMETPYGVTPSQCGWPTNI